MNFHFKSGTRVEKNVLLILDCSVLSLIRPGGFTSMYLHLYNFLGIQREKVKFFILCVVVSAIWTMDISLDTSVVRAPD